MRNQPVSPQATEKRALEKSNSTLVRWECKHLPPLTHHSITMFIDPKCLTVNLIHNVQRATEGKAAGRTFSMDAALGEGGRTRYSAPLGTRPGPPRTKVRGVRVPGRHNSYSKPTPGGGSTAPPGLCPAPRAEPERGGRRTAQPPRGRAGRGHDWLEAGPTQELPSRRLMGIVVLGISQASSKGSGNYTSC